MSELVQYGLDFEGTLDRVRAELGSLPARIDIALRRANRKLNNWLKRQVLREVARAAGAQQKTLKRGLRYYATLSRDGAIDVWIGTNPLKAHHLGRVRWTRRMHGARAGRRLFQGSWSWGEGSKSGIAIMQRLTGDQLPIDVVRVDIHEAVLARLNAMQIEITRRWERLVLQEANYVFNVEVTR